ncbi:MAG: universal stress protein [Halobacteriota archaeon]
MFDITDVLVATDGELGSRDAVEYAVAEAKAQDARLHALYVVDSDVYDAYSGDEYVHDLEGLESALESEGEHALDAVEEAAGDIEVRRVLRHGRPHEVVLRYIDEQDVDLVIMGTERRPEEYRQVLGSVTDRVTRLSEKPVVVVKTPTDED